SKIPARRRSSPSESPPASRRRRRRLRRRPDRRLRRRVRRSASENRGPCRLRGRRRAQGPVRPRRGYRGRPRARARPGAAGDCGAAEALLTPEEFQGWIAAGLPMQVVSYDVAADLERRHGGAATGGTGALDDFITYSETEQFLHDLAAARPDITHLETIGFSLEGRPIDAMKVSDNPDVDEDEPEVLLTGIHHARE